MASTVRLDYGQDVFGAQLGYDFGGVGDDGRRASVIGITGGYANSKLRFERGNADRFKYEAANVGAYGRAAFGPFFAKAYLKYEHYWINSSNWVLISAPAPRARLRSDGRVWREPEHGQVVRRTLRIGRDCAQQDGRFQRAGFEI